ncbi:g1 s regulator [Moniliophthora roreri MCA 2997]|uniref:G1 s regulator n=2 Tax=Moniliophthora roreri TaxID=221103 RepID=V2XJB4_MONRO|nr:g1 s regulator [Moniliophthora roreri MCA 2997]KAI3615162.1 g1 s regulator [Moniliophthora roreri]
MANVERPSLPLRLPARIPLSPAKQSRVASGTKRARSPAIGDQTSRPAVKRARPAVPAAATPNTEKQKAKAERQARKDEAEAEFRFKYKRHIARSRFYFDMVDIKDESIVRGLTTRIKQLGGQIEDFLQSSITHFICFDIDRASKAPEEPFEKENRSHGHARGGNASRRSPSKSTATRLVEEESAISKARSWEHVKIWDLRKLDSVLHRCLQLPDLLNASNQTQPPLSNTNPNQTKKLTRLLQSEKLHGSTERDPTQKRSDYHYFSPGSCFLLVEDVRHELATIAAMEWQVPKRKDVKTPWPTLYCHPQSRGPFIPFDERERRRWEKSQLAEKECRKEQEENRKKKLRQFEEALKRKEAQKELRRTGGDLRRSVSMNNLRRQGPDLHGDDTFEDVDHDDALESANASGYLASGTGGYMAASGNSVHITSTTGTTSTSSFPFRRGNLPLNLQAVANQEIITSRKVTRLNREQKPGAMGPPAGIPDKQNLLRKSKSMNTIRLSKREEGSKPGYCESCRMKFDDFKQHITCSKHKKFANNDANFSQLDCVLDRVRRKTIEEVRRERGRPPSRNSEPCEFFLRSDEEMYDVADEAL